MRAALLVICALLLVHHVQANRVLLGADNDFTRKPNAHGHLCKECEQWNSNQKKCVPLNMAVCGDGGEGICFGGTCSKGKITGPGSTDPGCTPPVSVNPPTTCPLDPSNPAGPKGTCNSRGACLARIVEVKAEGIAPKNPSGIAYAAYICQSDAPENADCDVAPDPSQPLDLYYGKCRTIKITGTDYKICQRCAPCHSWNANQQQCTPDNGQNKCGRTGQGRCQGGTCTCPACGSACMACTDPDEGCKPVAENTPCGNNGSMCKAGQCTCPANCGVCKACSNPQAGCQPVTDGTGCPNNGMCQNGQCKVCPTCSGPCMECTNPLLGCQPKTNGVGCGTGTSTCQGGQCTCPTTCPVCTECSTANPLDGCKPVTDSRDCGNKGKCGTGTDLGTCVEPITPDSCTVAKCFLGMDVDDQCKDCINNGCAFKVGYECTNNDGPGHCNDAGQCVAKCTTADTCPVIANTDPKVCRLCTNDHCITLPNRTECQLADGSPGHCRSGECTAVCVEASCPGHRDCKDCQGDDCVILEGAKCTGLFAGAPQNTDPGHCSATGTCVATCVKENCPGVHADCKDCQNDECVLLPTTTLCNNKQWHCTATGDCQPQCTAASCNGDDGCVACVDDTCVRYGAEKECTIPGGGGSGHCVSRAGGVKCEAFCSEAAGSECAGDCKICTNDHCITVRNDAPCSENGNGRCRQGVCKVCTPSCGTCTKCDYDQENPICVPEPTTTYCKLPNGQCGHCNGNAQSPACEPNVTNSCPENCPVCYTCDAASGACVPDEYQVGNQCDLADPRKKCVITYNGSGELVVPLCQVIPCTKPTEADDCAPCESCSNNICTPDADCCATDDDCPSCATCKKNGKCKMIACTTCDAQNPCTGEGQYCMDSGVCECFCGKIVNGKCTGTSGLGQKFCRNGNTTPGAGNDPTWLALNKGIWYSLVRTANYNGKCTAPNRCQCQPINGYDCWPGCQCPGSKTCTSTSGPGFCV